MVVVCKCTLLCTHTHICESARQGKKNSRNFPYSWKKKKKILYISHTRYLHRFSPASVHFQLNVFEQHKGMERFSLSLSPGRVGNSCISCLVWWLGRPAECLSHSPPSFPLNPPPSLLLWSRPAIVLRLTRHIIRTPASQNGLFQRQQEWVMFERYKLAQTHLIVLLVHFILHHKYWMPFKRPEALLTVLRAGSGLECIAAKVCAHAHTHTQKITGRLSNISSTSLSVPSQFFNDFFSWQAIQSSACDRFYFNTKQWAHFSQ